MATARITRTVIEAIIAANYMANASQIEQLSANVVEGIHASNTYLQVLVAHMQSKLGTPRRGKQPPQEPVLDGVHESLYPSVLRGVGPDDLDQRERFRRATFARSAASTVRYFVRHGGDVRGLDVKSVTKTGLRKLVTPDEAPEGETRTQKAFRKAQETMVRIAQRMARGDPDEARERIEATMTTLEHLLETLPAAPQDVGGQTTTIVAGRARGTGAQQPGAMIHRPTA